MDKKNNQEKISPEQQKKSDERRMKMEFLQKCKRTLQISQDSRRRYDYEWMVRDLFRRGYQFSRYQPNSQTVILASRQQAKIPINLVAAQLRSIRNQATAFRPKWETAPRYQNEESKTQARYTGMMLDYLFDHLKLKKMIKETVTQGLIFSIGGPWEVYFNEEKDEIGIWLLDPFDFYIDPLAESMEDAEYCIKAVRMPLGAVIHNPEFDEDARKQIGGPESRLAVSEYKQFIIQSMKIVSQRQSDQNEGVILFQGSFKMRDEDDGHVYIRKVVWTDQNFTPLSWEDTDEDEFDYEVYQADINPKEFYGEGWIKHVMPINRVINNLESSIFDYNTRVAKGRIVVDRDAGVRAIHNVHGEIISKNRGSDVRALDMPSLPIAVQNQIERMIKFQEDIGGVHDASLGRLPGGVRSGIGVAELKQADSTNQQDITDNLEDFLERVARKILKKIAKNYTTYHVTRNLGYRDSEAQYFAVVGDKSGKKGSMDEKHKGKVKIGPDWLDLVIVGEDTHVKVSVGSWLGSTKEMQEQKVLKFAEIGLIDQKTALGLLEFGNIDEIIQKTRIESLLKRNIAQGPQQNPEEDQYGMAMTENEMMSEGKDMPVDPHDDHYVHIALHQQVLGKGFDELVGKHISLHQMYMGQPGYSTKQPAQQPPPQNQPPQMPPGGPPPQQGMPQPGQSNAPPQQGPPPGPQTGGSPPVMPPPQG